MSALSRRLSRWLTLRGLFIALTTVLGVGLFARSVQAVGADGIRDGLTRVGWGFVVILLLSGAREVARTLAWMRSVEGPTRLGFAQAFRARLGGEALSTLLPMGMLVGEPAKATQVGPRIPFARAFAGLAVEFAFYTASLVPVMIAGGLTFMAVAHLRIATRSALVTVLTVTAVASVAVVRVKRRAARQPRPSADISSARRKSIFAQGIARVRQVGDLVLGFRTRHPRHVAPIVAYEVAFHLLSIAEVYVTLWLVSPAAPTLASAVVLETVGRVITVAFQALPMRVGVDEAAAALFAGRLNLGSATGITLALVRKLRLLFWSAIGLAMLMYRAPAGAGTPAVYMTRRTTVAREQLSV
ncbi:MAG: flippase-like domain-containing protein [Acidobacteria bacterium]|nr:flippase-like domain-containing protein [Acidobacteriota bacterium]